MIDPITALSLVLSILIVGCFFLLLIMQIDQFANRKIENLFFIIALVAGTVGITSYIFEIILAITSPNDYITINLHSYLFFFFTVCFYFWYKHYQKIIIFKERPSRFDFLKRLNVIPHWLEPISTIDVLFFIGFFIDIFYYLCFLLNIQGIFNFFWDMVHLSNNQGRTVAILSHIAFMGGWVFFYITYIIIVNNLVELNKVTLYELLAIISLGFSNVFLFINDLFLTFSVYHGDVGNLIVGLGLLVVFISLIMLLVNFIVLNPSHVQSPSLYKDIAELIRTIDAPGFTNSEFISKNIASQQLNSIAELESLNIPQKLNGTCIFILIYLMKNLKLKNLLAKDLEADLKLNKSTISYNLKILEKNEFVNRTTPIELKATNRMDDELDQRQKIISITEAGKDFLISLHQYLGNIF